MKCILIHAQFFHLQTTLDDVCMIVFCSAVRNCILLGLSRMLLQSYSINLLSLT